MFSDIHMLRYCRRDVLITNDTARLKLAGYIHDKSVLYNKIISVIYINRLKNIHLYLIGKKFVNFLTFKRGIQKQKQIHTVSDYTCFKQIKWISKIVLLKSLWRETHLVENYLKFYILTNTGVRINREFSVGTIKSALGVRYDLCGFQLPLSYTNCFY